MEPIAFLEQFGIPLTVAAAFGYFIWKQNQFIQNELMEELDERFKRLEGITIKLIDQIKATQLDFQALKGYVEGIEHILKKLFKKEHRDN
tara:strand:+ start:480 stop:749 length:270 start_codon:yes stop_codon:yes gene_type:complete